MAQDIEIRMISKAIRERNLNPLHEAGVEEEWFKSDEGQQIYRFACDWAKKYGECPSSVTVKAKLPGYRLLRVEDNLTSMVSEFVALHRNEQTNLLLGAARAALLEGDHESALDIMAKGSAQLLVTKDGVSRELDLTDAKLMPPTIARYMELRGLEGGLRGLPTGFPTIDKATSGLQNQQLITIIAPPKTGKSTLALAIARNVHRLSDKDILFVTFEQSNAEHEARYIAMVGKIGHTDLMTGKLTPKQEKKLLADWLATSGGARVILSDAPSNSTLSGLAAKVDQIKPAVLFVDGVYLMRDEVTGENNTPQALTNITRGLHRMAQTFDIPIVISTQALKWKMKKNQVDADSIGYSSSFFQDSDVILALQAVENDDELRELKVVASRNCPKVQVFLDWDWTTTSFTEQGADPTDPEEASDELEDTA